MEGLIKVMNKLQDLSSTNGVGLPTLPQIVVIGEQSSGKSSVLESLVKQSILPRGEGLVTRCPIVLQLIHTPLGPYASSGGNRPAEEWCEFLHKPDKIYTNFEEAMDEIQAQVNRIAGSNKGIVSDRITVKIFSPRVLTLTVVDLPGFVKVPIGDQPVNIEDQVNKMVKSFVEDPKTIILAVCSAVQDIAASESIKFAKKYDREGLRTVVVLTKLDMMSPGSDAEDTLKGRTLPVKLGIVGVVNRSHKENQDNKLIELAIDDEEAFLKQTYPAVAARNGSRYLAKKLQKILMDHISQCLPAILAKLYEMRSSVKEELEEYGEAPSNRRRELLDLINDFSLVVDSAIDGKSRRIPNNNLLGGERINHAFENVLTRELNTIDPQDIKTKQILITARNSEGLEHFFLNPEKAFRDLAKSKILMLEQPVLECARHAYEVMNKLTSTCFKSLGHNLSRFPNLTSAIKEEANAMLAKYYEEVQEYLKKYVKVQANFTHTPTEIFKSGIVAMVKQATAISNGLPLFGVDSNGHEIFIDEVEDDVITFRPEITELCLTIKTLVLEYFKVIQAHMKIFVPNAVAFDMVYKFQDNVRTTLTERLFTDDRIDDLLKETLDITEKREDAQRRLEALNEAVKILAELRDSESRLL